MLLLSLRSAYHARNGYHNFSHAADVTQACYSFLVRMGLAPPLYLLCEDDYDPNLGEGRRKWRRNRAVEEGGMGELLRPMDVFPLMVAAIGHDVGHPGLSNAYMVRCVPPLDMNSPVDPPSFTGECKSTSGTDLPRQIGP